MDKCSCVASSYEQKKEEEEEEEARVQGGEMERVRGLPRSMKVREEERRRTCHKDTRGCEMKLTRRQRKADDC